MATSGAVTVAKLDPNLIVEHVSHLTLVQARDMIQEASREIQTRKDEIQKLNELKHTIKGTLLRGFEDA